MTVPLSIRSLTRRPALLVIAVLIAGGIAGGVLVLRPGSQPGSADPAVAGASGEVVALEFKDGTGATRSLAQFRGKALLVNFWATWCAPCREEMPALDRLQEKLGSEQFEVIALSLDRGGPERASRFLLDFGNRNLTLYLADITAVRRAIGVFGLPTTLLLDREGREVYRVVGPAEWDSPEMIAEVSARLGLPVPQASAENESRRP